MGIPGHWRTVAAALAGYVLAVAPVFAQADLTVTKSHVGDFAQGQTGAQYIISVQNVGPSPVIAGNTVTVVDTLPAGLTATNMSGPGWTCVVATVTCTTNNPVLAGGSYFNITLTVSVAGNAGSPLVNSVTVSGGGEINTANDTATDSTNVLPPPDLSIIKTHVGNFVQGQTDAQYTISVSNAAGVGSVSAGNTVTVVDTLPAGLTATAMSGAAWTCDVPTVTCTNNVALPGGASYHDITLTVSVAPNAASSLVNSVTVSGGGDISPANDTATDPTTVLGPPDLTVSKTHVGNFVQGQTGAQYTITVNNVGASGVRSQDTVTLVDTLPAGLTATAMSGFNWDCDVATVTCTKNFALAPGQSYPAITLTVSVAGNAGSPLVNSVSVSGGAQVNTSNDTATDSTIVLVGPDLVVNKTHVGNFAQGQTGAQYTITVSNSGGQAVAAGNTVTVVDALPAGLAATGMSGIGWTCVVATVTCTTNTGLAAGQSYPAITLTVSVAGNAGSPLTNTVTVSGGGDANTSNNSAVDSTVIAPSPPSLQGAVSRKVHGGIGTFDLPLLIDVTNPTTEPRRGPTHSIVLTFDKPITGATVTVTESVAMAGAPTFNGNDVVVGLTGVPDQQYVTIALTNVASADGGAGGTGTVRIGFLMGDVTQNRVVTVADLGQVNAQLALPVTAANYLKDVNATGTLTVADKGFTNANLTRFLPPP